MARSVVVPASSDPALDLSAPTLPTSPRAARTRLAVALAGALAAPCLAALVAPGDARAASKIDLVPYDIELGEKLTEAYAEDLDGDGKKDLFLLLGREVRIFFQRADGFAKEPDQRFRIDPRAVLIDMGDVLGEGKKQIACLREDGVWIHVLRPGEGDSKPFYELKARRLLACETLLRRPSDDEVRRKEFLRDIDGDGRIDVLVPERLGFGVYRGLPGGKLGEREELRAPPTSVVNVGTDQLSSNLVASYYYANPNVSDWDADGKPEIVMALDQWLTVFKQTAEGRLPPGPTTVLEVPGTKAFTLDAEKPFELDFTMPLVLRDLNADKRLDAALTHVGTGTTRVFLNGPDPATAWKEPAQVVRAKGITFLAFFVDLDGDGLDDMILPRMDKIGIWSILKAVVTRSVPVEAQVFYQRKTAPGANGAAPGASAGPMYPDEPDFSRELEIPIALHSKGDGLDVGTSLIVSLDGDFDGDGLKDLVYRTEKDKVSIFPGLAGRRGVAAESACDIPIQNTDDYRFVLPVVEDLNGDGRADLLLRYVSWDRKGDRVTVFLSRP